MSDRLLLKPEHRDDHAPRALDLAIDLALEREKVLERGLLPPPACLDQVVKAAKREEPIDLLALRLVGLPVADLVDGEQLLQEILETVAAGLAVSGLRQLEERLLELSQASVPLARLLNRNCRILGPACAGGLLLPGAKI